MTGDGLSLRHQHDIIQCLLLEQLSHPTPRLWAVGGVADPQTELCLWYGHFVVSSTTFHVVIAWIASHDLADILKYNHVYIINSMFRDNSNASSVVYITENVV